MSVLDNVDPSIFEDDDIVKIPPPEYTITFITRKELTCEDLEYLGDRFHVFGKNKFKIKVLVSDNESYNRYYETCFPFHIAANLCAVEVECKYYPKHIFFPSDYYLKKRLYKLLLKDPGLLEKNNFQLIRLLPLEEYFESRILRAKDFLDSVASFFVFNPGSLNEVCPNKFAQKIKKDAWEAAISRQIEKDGDVISFGISLYPYEVIKAADIEAILREQEKNKDKAYYHFQVCSGIDANKDIYLCSTLNSDYTSAYLECDCRKFYAFML